MVLRRLLCRASIVLATLAFPALPIAVGAQSSAAARRDSVAVAAALRRFLTAFENLEWEPFRAAFADSATVFHPAANTPGRVTGRAAVDSTFRASAANATRGASFTSTPPTSLRRRRAPSRRARRSDLRLASSLTSGAVAGELHALDAPGQQRSPV